MKIKLYKDDIWDYIIMVLLFLEIAVLNYFNVATIGRNILVILILPRIAFYKKGLNEKILLLLWTICVIATAFVSAKRGVVFDRNILYSNLYSLISVMVIVAYIMWVSKYKSFFLTEIMEKAFGLFNIFFWINVIVICLQLNESYFMVGYSDWTNYFYTDLIAGVFGYSCTPQLAFYSTFIVIYNLHYAVYRASKERKLFMYGYVFLLIVLNLIICSWNDNKIVIVMLPFLLVAFYIYSMGQKKASMVIGKILIAVLIVFLVGLILFIVYSSSDSFYKIVDATLGGLYRNFQRFLNDPKVKQSGSIERFYMIIYAFEHYNGWTTGYGIAAYRWLQGSALGFVHFGQSNLGTFLCLGGLIFTVPLITLFIHFAQEVARYNLGKNIGIQRLIVIAYVFFILLYSQPCNVVTIAICSFLPLIVLGMVSTSVNVS